MKDDKVIGFSQRATPADVRCLILAKLGFSAACIGRQTGLTLGQVHYRCAAAGVKMKHYRDGESEFSRHIMDAASESSELYVHQLKDELRRLMADRMKRIDAPRAKN